MGIFRVFNRAVLLPVTGFTLGLATFVKGWPEELERRVTDATNVTTREEIKPSPPPDTDTDTNNEALKRHFSHNSLTRQPLALQRIDILDKIIQLPLYKRLVSDPKVESLVQGESIPKTHQPNHVAQGLLFGKDRFEIDPLVFRNQEVGTLVGFYHLGKEMCNDKKKIHRGVEALILDEGLCFCGFPSLPHGRGVTASLNLEFVRDIPEDTTVMLRARVVETKGRKCVIEGTLESLPRGSGSYVESLFGRYDDRGTVYAKAKCIIVEPKWFKYVKWLHTF